MDSDLKPVSEYNEPTRRAIARAAARLEAKIVADLARPAYRPMYDRVILASDQPGFVRGVALPDGYSWIQATGEVLASNSCDIPVGSIAVIVPGAGERIQIGNREWVRIVEEHDVLATVEADDEEETPS